MNPVGRLSSLQATIYIFTRNELNAVATVVVTSSHYYAPSDTTHLGSESTVDCGGVVGFTPGRQTASGGQPERRRSGDGVGIFSLKQIDMSCTDGVVATVVLPV